MTEPMNQVNSYCPVKQRRALLESNPPRDNWIDGDEIKSVSTFGEANTSPNEQGQTFISEPEHAFKNSSKTPATETVKNYLSWYPFFRSKPRAASSSCAVMNLVFMRTIMRDPLRHPTS